MFDIGTNRTNFINSVNLVLKPNNNIDGICITADTTVSTKIILKIFDIIIFLGAIGK